MEIKGAPPDQRYLTIQRSSDLYLPVLGFGDDVRFARIFRDTWRRIPLWARRRLVGYWRQSQHWLLPVSPCIELLGDWFERDRDLGCVGRAGHEIWFWAPIVDAFPEVHVAELIAHELAHVLLRTCGWEEHTNREVHRWDDPIEEAADEVMEDWGFDPNDMDVWVYRNRPEWLKKMSS
jgi:hypothetical protein